MIISKGWRAPIWTLTLVLLAMVIIHPIWPKGQKFFLESSIKLSCNPDHIDSFCPNKDPFRSLASSLTQALPKVLGSKGKDEPIRKFEDNFTKWCFIYFNRFGSQHQKNVHDCFNAFYPRFEISKNSQNPEYKLGYLSEVRIEPFQTVDHHQKNLYEKRFCNPADFNLQYKHFDDLDRCRKIGHVTCTGNVCGRSFARAANQPFSSRFRFSVLIERQRKMAPSPMAPNYSSPQKPKFDRFDYHVVLNNTGDEPIWFNCLLFDICESKYFGLTSEVFAFRFFHYMRIQIDLTFIIRYNLGFFHNFKL